MKKFCARHQNWTHSLIWQGLF